MASTPCGRRLTSFNARVRWAGAAVNDTVSCASGANRHASVAARVENLAGKSGVVGQAFRRQRNRIGPIASRQRFAGKRVPDRFVEQARGIAAADDKLTGVEMIRVAPREASDGVFAPAGTGFAGIRDTGQGLQDRQRAQLQRVEL